MDAPPLGGIRQLLFFFFSGVNQLQTTRNTPKTIHTQPLFVNANPLPTSPSSRACVKQLTRCSSCSHHWEIFTTLRTTMAR